jgi:hypothetical protein
MVFRAFSTPFGWVQYKRGLSSPPVVLSAFQALVVGGLESAAESSLSGDDSETNTKGLIRATSSLQIHFSSSLNKFVKTKQE